MFSTPTESRRFPVVALDSSEARMPLPRVAMYLAVAQSSSSNGLDEARTLMALVRLDPVDVDDDRIEALPTAR